MFDCIIVGAGPAGATAAYHLAKRGHTVLVLEKETFPRSKPCGGGVSPAVAQWFDFDFTPVIDNTVTKVHYSWKQGDAIEVHLKGIEPMWMVRRESFDHFLIKQALEQGAELREATAVTAIAPQSDGWQIATTDGNLMASYLIAADGVNGPLAEWLGLEGGQRSPGATLEIEAAVPPEQQHTAFFEFGAFKNGYIWNFPKSDGYSISAGFFRGNKGKPEELKQQLTKYAEQFGAKGTSRYSQYFLKLWSDPPKMHTHRALVAGEAAGILDPLIGEGNRPAMLTGLKAAEAISSALAGQEALAEYTEIINSEWGADMVLSQRLAGLFYQFPKIAYKVGVKRPAAAQVMGKILCGELRYSDVTDQAVKKLKKSLIPGF
ncbi:MAG: NAD(P)/FAD-dependent oxidoreductase [Cyanophyceae cyanobacterium]